MSEVKGRIARAICRLRVKLTPKPRRESFAEHAYKGAVRHAKNHPACLMAQKLDQERSNPNLDRRLRRLEHEIQPGPYSTSRNDGGDEC